MLRKKEHCCKINITRNGKPGTWSLLKMAESDLNIQIMMKASKNATGRTKKSLALPERSLTAPTFSTNSSTSDAKKIPFGLIPVSLNSA